MVAGTTPLWVPAAYIDRVSTARDYDFTEHYGIGLTYTQIWSLQGQRPLTPHENNYLSDLRIIKMPSNYDENSGYTSYYVFYAMTVQDFMDYKRSNCCILPKRRGYDKLNLHFDMIYAINFHYDYLSSKHELYDAESSNGCYVIGLRLNYRSLHYHFTQNNAGLFSRHYLDTSYFFYSDLGVDSYQAETSIVWQLNYGRRTYNNVRRNYAGDHKFYYSIIYHPDLVYPDVAYAKMVKDAVYRSGNYGGEETMEVVHYENDDEDDEMPIIEEDPTAEAEVTAAAETTATTATTDDIVLSPTEPVALGTTTGEARPQE